MTGAVLLVGRLMPERKRRGWYMAALIVGGLMVVIGPIWGTVAYLCNCA